MDKDKEIENLLERIEELKQDNKNRVDRTNRIEEQFKNELNQRKPYWSLSKVLTVITILFSMIFFLISMLKY